MTGEVIHEGSSLPRADSNRGSTGREDVRTESVEAEDMMRKTKR